VTSAQTPHTARGADREQDATLAGRLTLGGTTVLP
jgi:hypothetical protein